MLFHRNKQSTEHMSELGHNTLTSSQPVFVLFLYLILRAKQTFFFISVLSLQIQLSRRQRAVIQFFNILPDTCLCQSQARNWIYIDICCGLFFNHLKRDVVVCFVDIGGFYFHHFNFSFNKYQFYSVWFVPKEDQIHDIPHLRQVP